MKKGGTLMSGKAQHATYELYVETTKKRNAITGHTYIASKAEYDDYIRAMNKMRELMVDAERSNKWAKEIIDDVDSAVLRSNKARKNPTSIFIRINKIG